jgi:hypothetical protein
VSVSPVAIREWLRSAPPLTPKHREWLELIRDYTLYINLHVQIRPHWRSEYFIHQDVRELVATTRFPDIMSQRMRMLRTADPSTLVQSPQPTLNSILESSMAGGIQSLLFPRQLFATGVIPTVISYRDIISGLTGPTASSSSESLDANSALAAIRDALFRM